MLKGVGCTIYESQPRDRYCRICSDQECVLRWKKVISTFPLNREVTLSDSAGDVHVTRTASRERPIYARWHKKRKSGWDKSAFLLYWKSLDQKRRYHDPDDHFQAERVATLVGGRASV